MMTPQKVLPENAILWIDVRTPQEFQTRCIKGHINIPYERILAEVTKLGIALNQQVKLYCRTGRRSGIAASTLIEQGYTNVTNAGSFDSVQSLGS